MSNAARRYKKYFDSGWYTKGMLQNLVKKGAITQEEYEEIISGGEEEGRFKNG